MGAEDPPCKGGCVPGPPGELCASSAPRPGAMPPSLPFPPSQPGGTRAPFPPLHPCRHPLFCSLFSLFSKCFGAEIISKQSRSLVAIGGSRHR